MLNLAIECSGIAGSVALFEGDRRLDYRVLAENTGSVRSLAPAIASMLSTLPLPRVELISVTHGPGSFTGLRAGLATAKMLALAWDIPIVPVDTLHAIAFRYASHWPAVSNAPCALSDTPVIVPVLNAFRKQVFAAAWQVRPRGPADRGAESQGHGSQTVGPADLFPVAASQVLDAGRWQAAPLASLVASFPGIQAQSVILSGPGLASYRPLPGSGSDQAPNVLWQPMADEVALLGLHGFQLGRAVSPLDLAPNYVRPSAAEEQARG